MSQECHQVVPSALLPSIRCALDKTGTVSHPDAQIAALRFPSNSLLCAPAFWTISSSPAAQTRRASKLFRV